MTVSVAPSAISTGGRSMCGSPCASAPPTVATLRTRTFDSVSKRAGDERRVLAHVGRALQRAERRHRADAKPVGVGRDAGILALDLAQADELFRIEHAGLHHQHQRGAAGDRAHRSGRPGSSSLIAAASEVGSARSNGIIYPPARTCANAARSRAANCFSMSLALERSTGWPMLPSLPASVDSTE